MEQPSGTPTHFCGWTHKSPHKGALEANYTLWLQPPLFCRAYLHNRHVLIERKQPMGERTQETNDQWVSC